MTTLPLKIWLWVLLLSAVFIGFISFFSKDIGERFSTREKMFFHNNLKEEIALKNHSLNKNLRILIIGSSLSRDAIPEAHEIDSLLKKKHKINTSTIKFLGAIKGIDHLTDQGILEDILAFKPDVLIVQESSFFNELKVNDKLYQRYHLKSHVGLTEIFSALLGNKKKRDRKGIFTPSQDQFEALVSKRLAHLQSKQPKKKTIQNISNILNSLNSKLIILNIPRPYQIEKRILATKSSIKYSGYWNWCKNLTHFDYFNFDYSFTYNHFYDAQHMNNHGKKIFTNWFINELGAHITNNQN